MSGEMTELEELRQRVRDLEAQLCQRNARARIRAVRHIRDAQMRELDRERRRKERLESDRMRMLWLQEFSLRQTSIVAAEKAIRRLRKGRDNARSLVTGLKALIDGAADIVELFQPQTPSQIVWREDWLRKAREALK